MMALYNIGISHKSAPVELREHLSLNKENKESMFRDLISATQAEEAVILSTCNRFEVFANIPLEKNSAKETLIKFMKSLYSHPGLPHYLHHHVLDDAVHHLFRVSAGLESLVVGETEILGQVKSAYLTAKDHGITGKITNVLFQRALYVGKSVRAQTHISEGASSVGSIAVQLASRIFGALNNHRILVLGAGEIAEVAIRHFMSQKVGALTILNRTKYKAEELARRFQGKAGPLEQLGDALLDSDIVIGSVSLDKPIVTKDMIQPIMKKRRDRPLYFIDIAVPRNIHQDVHSVDNVYVYNIDDLYQIVQGNIFQRKTAIDKAETLVEEMSTESSLWLRNSLAGQQSTHRHTKVSC